MKRESLTFLLFGLLLAAPAVVGCSSGGSGAAASGNTTSCWAQIGSLTPTCQFYEATGPDAARAIAQLRAGCVDQSGIQMKPVDVCPSAGSVGGCKTPVKVEGGANVQLYVTNYDYASDAGGLTPQTPAAEQQFCHDEGEDGGVYVPAGQ